jgi:predicted cupin superfamily sugar epimerase
MSQQNRVDFLVEKNWAFTILREDSIEKLTDHRETINTLRKKKSSYVYLLLLTSAHVSRFHQIQSDEHWYFHEGAFDHSYWSGRT